MKLRNTLIALAVTGTLMGSVAMTATAQTSATSSVTIGGGNFSASMSASNFGSLPYSLTDQFARNGNLSLNVTDLTGDAGGWQVAVNVTDFVGQTRSAEVIPVANLSMTNAVMSVATDGSQPVTAGMRMTPSTTGDGPEFVWIADPGSGQGSYVLSMTADLMVPGRTTVQTYMATGTVTIVTGP
jgi:hypothetical protein